MRGEKVVQTNKQTYSRAFIYIIAITFSPIFAVEYSLENPREDMIGSRNILQTLSFSVHSLIYFMLLPLDLCLSYNGFI